MRLVAVWKMKPSKDAFITGLELDAHRPSLAKGLKTWLLVGSAISFVAIELGYGNLWLLGLLIFGYGLSEFLGGPEESAILPKDLANLALAIFVGLALVAIDLAVGPMSNFERWRASFFFDNSWLARMSFCVLILQYVVNQMTAQMSRNVQSALLTHHVKRVPGLVPLGGIVLVLSGLLFIVLQMHTATGEYMYLLLQGSLLSSAVVALIGGGSPRSILFYFLPLAAYAVLAWDGSGRLMIFGLGIAILQVFSLGRHKSLSKEMLITSLPALYLVSRWAVIRRTEATAEITTISFTGIDSLALPLMRSAQLLKALSGGEVDLQGLDLLFAVPLRVIGTLTGTSRPDTFGDVIPRILGIRLATGGSEAALYPVEWAVAFGIPHLAYGIVPLLFLIIGANYLILCWSRYKFGLTAAIIFIGVAVLLSLAILDFYWNGMSTSLQRGALRLVGMLSSSLLICLAIRVGPYIFPAYSRVLQGRC